ncbi:MAG: diaminopimelate epimerase [Planctomycetota bacterium]
MPSSGLPFTKMHGCGNDYVVVDATSRVLEDPGALARRMTDRRRGVGADGLLLALEGDGGDLRMRMFNADGSEAGMCGNGLRCLVKFAWERGLVPRRREGDVQTGAGTLHWWVESLDGPRVDLVTIDMGRPRLDARAIPMEGGEGPMIDVALEVGDGTWRVSAVSMGNPHVVIWVDDVDEVALATVGPLFEHHPAFPEGTNTEFVRIVSPEEVEQRTWERGCGETLACGTGASAVVVAGVESGRLARDVRVRLRGGELRIRYDEHDGHVRMTGPAVEVFEGVWPPG